MKCLGQVDEDPVRLAATILSRTGTRIHPLDIDNAFREGPKSQKRPRPLVVVLVRKITKIFVMKNRKKIKQFEDCARVWINEDLTVEKRRQWSEMRLIVEQANREGMSARQAGDVIIVEGIRYKHQDLHKLPGPLCLENATIRKTPKGYAFYSKHCCLSNFAPAPFVYEGQDYVCLEQAYHYTRAYRAGKFEIARKILLETDPLEIKRLGGTFMDTDDWKKERRQIMKDLLIAKFEQNPVMLVKLMSTGNEPIIEANWDRTWASAAPFLSKEITNGTWKGQNLLGILLVEVRIYFKQKNGDMDNTSEKENDKSSEDGGSAEGVNGE